MSMIQEFKEFAVKGNVVDMAVGVIIGGAFGKIVSSLVTDVVMPPIGVLVGGVDFSKLAFTLQEATVSCSSCCNQLWEIHSNSCGLHYCCCSHFHGHQRHQLDEEESRSGTSDISRNACTGSSTDGNS